MSAAERKNSSSQIVDNKPAGDYETALRGGGVQDIPTVCGEIIRSEGGEITAYDGDRIMAVYIGDTKNTSAVQTAMKTYYAVDQIVMPALKPSIRVPPT